MTIKLLFKCKKCYHELTVKISRINLLPSFDCPNCGEEAYENWIFINIEEE